MGNLLAIGRDDRETGQECCGKDDLDCTSLRAIADVRYQLGAVMNAKKGAQPGVLDAVALLTDLPAQQLARGQVGTIVEELDDKTLRVEFSDVQGRAYAFAPCARADLLVLHARQILEGEIQEREMRS